MADMKWDPKDPDDVIHYEIDWADAITDRSDPDAPVVDPISSVAWHLPSGLLEDTSGSHAQTETDTKTRIWLKSGTAGVTYDVRCVITTVSGEIIDRTVKLPVKQPIRTARSE